ncbi:MAG: recombinase family protein [Desulfomonilaceae bacterium]
MKAIGYVRVSTEEQARGGISLDMQRAKIEAYASLEEMELVEIVEDAGLSGCSIKHRPGLQRVLVMIQQKQVQAVVIYKLDRLARNTLECLEMSRLIDRAKVSLHSITERLDTGSALGRFFFTLVASLAEMERGIISERIKAAMGRLKETGRVWSGNPPYGLQARDGLLIPEEQERTVINRIWCLRDEGHTIHQIGAILDSEGVRNRRGRAFGPSQIHTLITRKAS